MSDPQRPESAHHVVAPALDLERVVPAAGGAAAPGLICSACNKPVVDEYFEVVGKATCRTCKFAIEEAMTGGSRVARVIRASLAGVVAAAIGAYLYHALTKATDREFAIAALVLGAMVGGAVRWGAKRRGGWAYQWMAVLLTYASIGGAHLPEFIDAIQGGVSEPAASQAASPSPAAGSPSVPEPAAMQAGTIPPASPAASPAPANPPLAAAPEAEPAAAATAEKPAADAQAAEPAPDVPPLMKKHPFASLIVIGVVALAVAGAWPVFLLASEPGTALLGILITFFGLQAAWKMNRKLVVEFTGPYRVATDPAAAPDPATLT